MNECSTVAQSLSGVRDAFLVLPLTSANINFYSAVHYFRPPAGM